LFFTTSTGNTERTETTGSKFSDLVLVIVDNFFRERVVFFDGFEDKERSTLDADETFTFGGFDDGGNLLGDGIEGVELDDFVFTEDTFGTGVVTERLQESLVDSVETFGFAGSSETSRKHELVGIDTFNSVGFVERQLVLGEGSGFVRTENLDTGKRLDGAEFLDDSLLFGEVSSTDGHGGCDDSGKTDGDTDDGNGKGEFEDLNNAIRAVECTAS
jgi:hypothetical protein